MPETTQVNLPTFDTRMRRVGSEQLDVEILDGGRYRLIHSPGLVEGLAAGDVVELVATERTGFRVIHRGGNLCVWLIFENKNDFNRAREDRVHEEVKRIGGRLDGGTHRSFIFTVPVSVGFPAVERVFDDTVHRLNGTAWFYGNVYDPIDGETPLNWWSVE
jgi:hypothetical protein